MLPSQNPCCFSWYTRRNVSPSPYTLRVLVSDALACIATNARTEMIRHPRMFVKAAPRP